MTLARDATIYPEGLVTGFYGPLTVQAVQRFQIRYDIVTSGTPETTGFGLAGPRTIAKINEVFGGPIDREKLLPVLEQLRELLRRIVEEVERLISDIRPD